MLMINPTDTAIRVVSTCGFVTVVAPDSEVEIPENKVELCQGGGLLRKDMVDALVAKAKAKAKPTKPKDEV